MVSSWNELAGLSLLWWLLLLLLLLLELEASAAYAGAATEALGLATSEATGRWYGSRTSEGSRGWDAEGDSEAGAANSELKGGGDGRNEVEASEAGYWGGGLRCLSSGAGALRASLTTSSVIRTSRSWSSPMLPA